MLTRGAARRSGKEANCIYRIVYTIDAVPHVVVTPPFPSCLPLRRAGPANLPTHTCPARSATSRPAPPPPALTLVPTCQRVLGAWQDPGAWCAWQSSVEIVLTRQVIATREIQPKEELTVDYGEGYWGNQRTKPVYASSNSPDSAKRALFVWSRRIDVSAGVALLPSVSRSLPHRP